MQQADDQRLSVRNLVASTEKIKLQAWFDRHGQHRGGHLLVQYGFLSAGIAIKDDDIQVKLLRANQWYQDHLPDK